MPIFDFKCNKCGYEKEEYINDPEKYNIWCGQCKELMAKQMSTSNFYLKGRNWPGKDIRKQRS